MSRIGFLAVAIATALAGLALSSSAAFASKATPPVVHDDPIAPVAAQAVLDLITMQTAGNRAASDTADVAIVVAARDRYLASRDAIATDIANRLGLDPALMQQAWAAADYPHQTALMAAFSQLGVRYRRNKSEPGFGFDCSGLTSYAWGVAGVSLAHQSRTQINNAAKRTIDTAQAGDLAYYPGHVMLYLGVSMAIVHAPFTGRTIEVGNMGNRRSIRFGDPTR
jgi:cell wall-associated NlpC family hydrolase